ncbi:MAGE domain-containing protein [Sporobolomyces koalae]|uniref:MAGE domain-containing protein n=1 Tax=Sporobolomyces koalae TaxID=500713 RepID=UPI00316D7134
MARPSVRQKQQHAESDDDHSDAQSSPQASRRTSKAASKKKNKTTKRKKRTHGDDDDDDQEQEDDEQEDDEDDDDDDDRARKGGLSDTEKKEHIQAITRYILFNETHRRIIKREDIVKNVLTGGRSRHFAVLMPKVQKLLRDVMGMELVMLRPRETATGKNSPKAWILRSTIPQPLLRHAATVTSANYQAKLPFDFEPRSGKNKPTMRQELGQWMLDEDHLDLELNQEEGDDNAREDMGDVMGGVMRDAKREEGAAYGVLGTILALILVNGKALGDDQLISYLRRLNLTPMTPIPLTLAAPHPESLTLAAYLTLLTKQQYLERAKVAGAQPGATAGGGGATQTQAGRTQGPSRTQRATAEGTVQETGDPTIEWKWGARAEAELGEEGVARFVQYIFEAGANKNVAGGGGKRGRTGENFLAEVARSAGVKELQQAETIEGDGFN